VELYNISGISFCLQLRKQSEGVKLKGDLVTIVKNGKLINIELDRLSNGQILVVQTGDIVPADLRLVEAKGLEVDKPLLNIFESKRILLTY
jgi:magnesium-transporting ATPase (P-type)